MELAKAIERARTHGPKEEMPPLEQVSRDGDLELSYAQQRLWIIDQLEPGSAAYNIPIAIRIRGRLDVDSLEKTLQELVRRHEVLRTRIEMRGGRCVQVIEPAKRELLEREVLGGLSSEKREEEVSRKVLEETGRAFDLEHGPLLRVRVLKLGEEEHVLLVTMHHIVSDGWSMGVLVREVARLYEAFVKGEESPLPELGIQYADYAVWQREWLQGEILEGQLKYWREQLKDVPVLEMPTDHPRPAVASHRGAGVPVQISREVLKGLKELSGQEGMTLFMVLLAGFQVMLSRYSGQEDVAVGAPIANRRRAELEELIGFFVNQLVLRVDLSGDPSVREMLRRVREVCLGAYAHQDLPFERLVEDLNPKRDLSREPLFQVMLVLQNIPFGELRMGGLELTGIPQERVTAKFDLTLSMGESEEGLRGVMEYATDLYERATIERMLGHWERVLEEMVAKPEERISEIKMMREEERRQVVEEWDETEREYEKDRSIQEMFEEQVKRTPEATAVIFEGAELSYEELNRRANQVGHYLRGLGVGAEERVGICVERSLEMVVGLLGILKAGGAYVPLDPEYPPERLGYMLEDARVPVLLTQERIRERLPESDARIVELDKEWEQIARESSEDLPSVTEGENAAYVMYTSGSTGRPKGVVVTHGGLTNYLLWGAGNYAMEGRAGAPIHSSISFDLTITSLYVPLIRGDHIILFGNKKNIEEVTDTLAASRDLGLLKVTPSHLEALTLHGAGAFRGVVQVLIIGGEALSQQQLMRWREECPERRLMNEYGPTETVVGSCR